MTPLKTANARALENVRIGPAVVTAHSWSWGNRQKGRGLPRAQGLSVMAGAGEAALQAEARGCCHRGWVDAAQSLTDTANLSGVRSRHLQMWAPPVDGDKAGMRRTIKQRRGRDQQQSSPRSPSISNFPAPCEAPFWRHRLTPGWKGLPLREQQSHFSLSNHCLLSQLMGFVEAGPLLPTKSSGACDPGLATQLNPCPSWPAAGSDTSTWAKPEPLLGPEGQRPCLLTGPQN